MRLSAALSIGQRCPSLVIRLHGHARLGPSLTIEKIIDDHAGLCRVSVEGRPGRFYVTTIDTEFADEAQALRLVRCVNNAWASQIHSGIADFIHMDRAPLRRG